MAERTEVKIDIDIQDDGITFTAKIGEATFTKFLGINQMQEAEDMLADLVHMTLTEKERRDAL